MKISRLIKKKYKHYLKPKTKIYTNGKTFFVSSVPRRKHFWKNRYWIWEPYTFTIFNKFLDSNHSYIDIGAWIGPSVLYGCQLAKHCYAIEPDPIAFKDLKNNIKLNRDLVSRVSLSNQCITDSCGMTYLSPQPGSIGGNSSSSILYDKSLKSWQVAGITLEQFFLDHSIVDCNFIKIDIEGGESKALPSMIEFLKKIKPTLYLSLHPNMWPDAKKQLERIYELLKLYNYMYDKQLHEIGRDYILSQDDSKKPFEILVTDRNLKKT